MIIGSNAGHTSTGKGTGSVGFVNESICNRQINKYFMQGMIKLGNKVIDCTIEKSTNYLFEAVNIANKQKLDYAITHHLNHSDDESANGVEVWLYSGKNKNTVAAAERICDELSKLGLKNRGVKIKDSYYWLRKTNSEAMIIEYFFCSNKKDTGVYNPEKMANAVTKALTGKVPSETPNNNNVGPVKYPNGDYNCKARVIKVNSYLNVRQDRNTNSKVIGKLEKGSIVEVKYCFNNWFSTYETGNVGFIYGDYLELIK